MDVAGLFSISGKVTLVTGGSRGIGEMIARGYAAAGATVYVSSRTADACDALAAELNETGPGSAVSLPADLSTEQGCRQLADELSAREGRLDVLVNNAGAAWGAPLEDYPVDGFDKVMNLNVRAPFVLTQALLPLLRAAASDDDPARVINIGSIDGLGVPPLETYAYSASKAALHHLTRHLGRRLASERITVNAIAPGLFPSKMTAFMFERADEVVGAIPLGRAGRPEDVAGLAIHLASPAGAYVTGAVVPVDGGAVTLR